MIDGVGSRTRGEDLRCQSINAFVVDAVSPDADYYKEFLKVTGRGEGGRVDWRMRGGRLLPLPLI